MKELINLRKEREKQTKNKARKEKRKKGRESLIVA